MMLIAVQRRHSASVNRLDGSHRGDKLFEGENGKTCLHIHLLATFCPSYERLCACFREEERRGEVDVEIE
eukprot:1393809-Amorphochlora_amoeboformis.AAC.1